MLVGNFAGSVPSDQLLPILLSFVGIISLLRVKIVLMPVL